MFAWSMRDGAAAVLSVVCVAGCPRSHSLKSESCSGRNTELGACLDGSPGGGSNADAQQPWRDAGPRDADSDRNVPLRDANTSIDVGVRDGGDDATPIVELLGRSDDTLVRIAAYADGSAVTWRLSDASHAVARIYMDSPHEGQVAYETRGNAPGLYVVSLSGSSEPRALVAPEQIAEAGHHYEADSASFSMDGSWVAFRASDGERPRLMAVRTTRGASPPHFALPDDATAHRLLPGVRWAPDAAWLSFVVRESPPERLQAAHLWSVQQAAAARRWLAGKLVTVEPLRQGNVLGFERLAERLSSGQATTRVYYAHGGGEAEHPLPLDHPLNGNAVFPGLGRASLNGYGVLLEGRLPPTGTDALFHVTARTGMSQVRSLTDAETGALRPGSVDHLPGNHSAVFEADGLWALDLTTASPRSTPLSTGTLIDWEVAEDATALAVLQRKDDTVQLQLVELKRGAPGTVHSLWEVTGARALWMRPLNDAAGVLLCADLDASGAAALYLVPAISADPLVRQVFPTCTTTPYLVFSHPDGAYLATGDREVEGWQLWHLDLREGRQAAPLQVGPAAVSGRHLQVAVTNDGQWVFVTVMRGIGAQALHAVQVADHALIQARRLAGPHEDGAGPHPEGRAQLVITEGEDGASREATLWVRTDDMLRAIPLAGLDTNIRDMRWLR